MTLYKIIDSISPVLSNNPRPAKNIQEFLETGKIVIWDIPKSVAPLPKADIEMRKIESPPPYDFTDKPSIQ